MWKIRERFSWEPAAGLKWKVFHSTDASRCVAYFEYEGDAFEYIDMMNNKNKIVKEDKWEVTVAIARV